MSYILEALRRAETERERKRRVPGLHAQPVAVLPAEDSPAPRSRAWRWVALGLIGGLLLALLWRWWVADPAAEEEALAARAAATGSVTSHPGPVANPAPPPVALPPPTTAPEPPPTPEAPAATAERPPAHPPAQPARVARPAAKPEPRTTTSTAAAAPTAARSGHPSDGRATTTAVPTVATAPTTAARPAAAAVANPAGTAAASAPEARLSTLSELPLDLQRAVPSMSFGGSVYSEVPAQRIVILNGQVLREGDAVTDEIQLEQIRPRSAVMKLRGQRFEMPF